MDAQVDHVTGLLMLREGNPRLLPLAPVLSHYCVKRCDGHHSAMAIVEELDQKLGATGLGADVDDFLRAANERGWIS